MSRSHKKRISYVAAILAYCMMSNSQAAEYPSLLDAIKATDSPRTYTLDGTEISPTALGNIGGASSILTIDGQHQYGINNTFSGANARVFVDTNQTLNLKNLGSYNITTSSSIISGIDIITNVNIGESVNNYGIANDYVGFVRSRGTTNVSDSVFYNNFGMYGAALQNRENGTMSITGSVFANNSSTQGAVHSDGLGHITEISDSIFFNNIASEAGGAIYNKAGKTIDLITRSWFVDNYDDSYTGNFSVGTIYNAGTIDEISDSYFINTRSSNGAPIIYSKGEGNSIGKITNTVFVGNKGGGSIALEEVGGLSELSNLTFLNNEGKAISISGKSSLTIDKISDINIENNSNVGIGISKNTTGDMTINKIDNLNISDGGNKAVSIAANNGSIAIGEISNSTFSNNNDSALYIGGNNPVTVSKIDNVNFTNNTSVNYGGGILTSHSTISKIINSTFDGNSTNTSAYYGGAIHNSGSSLIGEISETIFNNNYAGYGGAISNSGDSEITLISNSTFSNNTTVQYGAAVRNSSGSTIGTISNSNFTGNKALNGTIYNEGSISNIIDSTFTNNETTNGGIIGIFGATTGKTAYIGEINNVEVNSNKGSGFFSRTTTAEAAVDVDKITLSKFTNNTESGISISGNIGIINIDEISNSEFNNNGGRGIYIRNNPDYTTGAITIGKITDSKFEGNTSGAIYFQKQSSNSLTVDEISGLEIKNNRMTTGNGAGIYNDKATINKISNVIFENNGTDYNTSGTRGGAIFNSGTINTIEDVDISNSSAYNGGAIYNTGTIGSITDMTVTDVMTSDVMIASENGGHIGTIDNLLIDNSSGTGLSFYGATAETIKKFYLH